MIGETVSHYRIVSRLGQGGMGEVYLAEDLRLRRPVALKMLRQDRDDAEARDRLLREARAASALSHPSIAVVYEIDDVEVHGERVRFIAMEYVPGATLAEVAKSGKLGLDGILEVALDAAEALAAAHERGVVHRDVKPSNIVLGEKGVKILDFGLAQQRVPFPGEKDSTWTRDPGREGKGLAGTLAYMAPEQALGEGVDGQADVFSLGAVLYELLAGRPAFERPNVTRTLDALLHEDPPALKARFDDPRVAALDAVVRRMLDRDRSRRYGSMREVCAELRAVRQGGVAASAATPASSRSVAVLGFANITGDGEDDWLGAGIAETLTADLRGVEGLAVVSRARVREILRRLAPADESDEGVAVRLGREADARFVLTGGFQRAGEALRVTARLLEVPSGAMVAAVKVDGRLAEVFALQDRLVRELGKALRLTILPAGSEADETGVVEAYEAFSKGLLNQRLETYESLDRAALFFDKAVRLDPAYAKAHLELGSAHMSKADYLGYPELYERAIASYRRALELQPRLVRAWREMGAALVLLGREDEGIEAIRRALDEAPEDPGALQSLGRALFIGRAQFAEAASCFDRALEKNPDAGWAALQLAHCAALLRDFPRGEAAALRAVALQERFLSGHERTLVIGAYMRQAHLASLQGRFEEALEALTREAAFVERVDHALRGRIAIELNMRRGCAQLRLGRAAEGRRAFDTALEAFESRVRLGADDPFTRYYAAGVHALRGETEEALVCLEKAAAVRRRLTLARARIEPEFEALRAEPRFRALVESG